MQFFIIWQWFTFLGPPYNNHDVWWQ